MVGLGLRLGLGRRGLGPMRLVPVSADEFYIVGPAPWGGALAHRIRRNLGGSGAQDVGSPWQIWRRTGTRELATIAGDPASPAFTISDDIGAFDYAMQEGTGSFRFGGSFHGGETVNTGGVFADGAVINPTVARRAGRFELRHTSTINYGGGRTMAVTYNLTFNPNGTLTESGAFNSSAAFASGQFPHMEIGQALFSRAEANGAMSDVSVTGDTALATAGDVTLYSPTTGHSIRTQSDAPAVLGASYNSTFVTRMSSPARSKLYYRRNSTAGGSLGSYSVSRTTSFAKAAPAILDADFATDLTGWTNVGSLSAVWNAANGGVARMTRSATVETRLLAPITCVIGATYEVNFDYTLGGGATTHAGGRIYVSNASNGTTTGALLNGLVNSYANRKATFVATQASHWFVLRQEAGTANEIIDWRFVTIRRIA